jgi:hypothetical protein
MRVIHKLSFDLQTDVPVRETYLPLDAKFLHVERQRNQLCLWYEWNNNIQAKDATDSLSSAPGWNVLKTPSVQLSFMMVIWFSISFTERFDLIMPDILIGIFLLVTGIGIFFWMLTEHFFFHIHVAENALIFYAGYFISSFFCVIAMLSGIIIIIESLK